MSDKIINELLVIIKLLNVLVHLAEQKPVPLLAPLPDPSLEKDKMLSRKETASLFDVSNRTISRWQEADFIKAIYIGGNIYFSQAELEQCVKMNKLNKKINLPV